MSILLHSYYAIYFRVNQSLILTLPIFEQGESIQVWILSSDFIIVPLAKVDWLFQGSVITRLDVASIERLSIRCSMIIDIELVSFHHALVPIRSSHSLNFAIVNVELGWRVNILRNYMSIFERECVMMSLLLLRPLHSWIVQIIINYSLIMKVLSILIKGFMPSSHLVFKQQLPILIYSHWISLSLSPHHLFTHDSRFIIWVSSSWYPIELSHLLRGLLMQPSHGSV